LMNFSMRTDLSKMKLQSLSVRSLVTKMMVAYACCGVGC
jgi:hypothetical protein